mgnify:FL=1
MPKYSNQEAQNVEEFVKLKAQVSALSKKLRNANKAIDAMKDEMVATIAKKGSANSADHSIVGNLKPRAGYEVKPTEYFQFTILEK